MPINVCVLGQLDMSEGDGKPIEAVLAQPKRLALLLFLLIDTPHRAHRRDALLALFWPDLPEDRARNSLSQALSFLRRTLGAEAIASINGHEVQANRERFSCDAIAFVAAVKRGDSVAALDLYGGPFLEAFHTDGSAEFEQWLDATRRNLHDSAVLSVRKLLTETLACGDDSAAQKWAIRAGALAPDDESITREIMLLHVRRGDRVAALCTFEAHAARLAAVLEMEPSRELNALAERIRDGSFQTVPRHRVAAAVVRSRTTDAQIHLTQPAVLSASPLVEGQVPRITPRPASRALSQRVAMLGVAAAAALVCAGLLSSAFGAHCNAERRVATTRTTLPLPDSIRIDSESAVGVPIALSPDDSVVAFIGGNNPRKLYLRRLNDLKATPLPGTEYARAPQFSTDGRWIVFHSPDGLKKISLTDARIEMLADSLSGFSIGENDLLIFARSGAGFRSSLYLKQRGGAARVLTTLDTAQGEIGHSAPQLLPGSRAAIFEIRNGVQPSVPTELAAVRLADGKVIRLGIQGSNPRFTNGFILFGRKGEGIWAVPFDAKELRVTGTPESILKPATVSLFGATSLAVSARGTVVYLSGGGGGQLILVDREGRATKLPLPMQAYRKPRFSPDGGRIALSVGKDGGHNVWIADISDAPNSSLTQFTFDGASQHVEWSADGRRLGWVTNDSTAPAVVWQQSADGSGKPIAIAKNRMLPHFSQRGSFLLMTRTIGDPGKGTVDLHPLSDDKTTTTLFPSNGATRMYKISPDEHWVAYVRKTQTQSSVLVRALSDTAGEHEIVVGEGTQPVWGVTSRELYYRGRGKLIAVTFATVPQMSVSRLDTLFADEFNGNKIGEGANYDVSRDGKQFVFVKAYSPTQLVFVVGLLNELRRRSSR